MFRPRSSAQRRTSQTFWIAGVLALSLFTLGPSLWPLVGRFFQFDENLSHGAILVALFVYFYFHPHQERFCLTWLSWRLSALGLAFSLSLGLLASVIPIDIVAQLTLIPILFFGLACLSDGTRASRFLGALGLLLFVIPWWEYTIPLLVSISSLVVEFGVGTLNIPVSLQMNTLILSQGTIIISDDCSGIRYLIIALCLGYLLCLINAYSPRQVTAVMGVALLLGLVANWLRIMVIVIVGVQTQLQSPLMSDHEYFGWILFACLLLPALYFAPAHKRIPPKAIAITPSPAQILVTVGLFVITLACYWSVQFISQQQPFKELRDQLPLAYAPINADRAPILLSSAAPQLQEFAQYQHTYVQLDHYQPSSPRGKLVPYLPRRPEATQWQLIDHHFFDENLPGQWLLWQHSTTQTQLITLRWFGLGSFHTNQLWQAKWRQTQARMSGVEHFTVFNLSRLCNDECHKEKPALLELRAQLINQLP